MVTVHAGNTAVAPASKVEAIIRSPTNMAATDVAALEWRGYLARLLLWMTLSLQRPGMGDTRKICVEIASTGRSTGTKLMSVITLCLFSHDIFFWFIRQISFLLCYFSFFCSGRISLK